MNGTTHRYVHKHNLENISRFNPLLSNNNSCYKERGKGVCIVHNCVRCCDRTNNIPTISMIIIYFITIKSLYSLLACIAFSIKLLMTWTTYILPLLRVVRITTHSAETVYNIVYFLTSFSAPWPSLNNSALFCTDTLYFCLDLWRSICLLLIVITVASRHRSF